jgi:AcrR family transcriptional regulator
MAERRGVSGGAAVLAAARRLFTEKGYRSTTAEEIAAAMGKSRGLAHVLMPGGKPRMLFEILMQDYAVAIREAPQVRLAARRIASRVVERTRLRLAYDVPRLRLVLAIWTAAPSDWPRETWRKVSAILPALAAAMWGPALRAGRPRTSAPEGDDGKRNDDVMMLELLYVIALTRAAGVHGAEAPEAVAADVLAVMRHAGELLELARGRAAAAPARPSPAA